MANTSEIRFPYPMGSLAVRLWRIKLVNISTAAVSGSKSVMISSIHMHTTTRLCGTGRAPGGDKDETMTSHSQLTADSPAMKYRQPCVSLVLVLLLTLVAQGTSAYGEGDTEGANDAKGRQYTFAWQYLDGDAMAPRGGTTKGSPVELVTAPGEAWAALQAPKLSKQERDRRAILAMAGPYRTSFDFIETVGFTEGYAPSRPYQSWGTEFVYVVANRKDFISLQHILVMRMQDADGGEAEPLVIKHWRQDWAYEEPELHTFRGNRIWARETLETAEVSGRWAQSVYQVDDSPRYMAVGKWRHYANHSSWESDETWRPLPRREFSVRDDYDVLVGTNRHTITPTGWVQEEDNLKVVLDDDGEPAQVLARENGLARYQRIDNYDWGAGDDYWQRTGPFWEVVRDEWRQLFNNNSRLGVSKEAGDVAMFIAMFQLADSSTEGDFDREVTERLVEKTLAPYVTK